MNRRHFKKLKLRDLPETLPKSVFKDGKKVWFEGRGKRDTDDC